MPPHPSYISWYPCLPRPLPRPRASLQSVASRYTAEEAAMMPPHRHCNTDVQRLQRRYIDHSSSPLELETKVRNHREGPFVTFRVGNPKKAVVTAFNRECL